MAQNSKNVTDKKRQPNLAIEIVNDLIVHKWTVLLILLNIATALMVVQFAHLNRQAFIEQDQLFGQRDDLDIEWRHNLLEQRTLAEHNRIETLVSEQLGLFRPKLANEVVVTLQ
ncbi:MAG: cell division protein FtsL [Phenylobacterium sp.]|jgi:cell division protein FtsL